MSNRDRIARAAEEVRLSDAEKTAKKAAKATPKAPRTGSKPAAKAQRMKIIWEVCNGNGKVVKTFSYPDKPLAEGATQQLTHSTGNTHILRATKVPME